MPQMRMPPYQLGIQFVQIGVDDEASAHLTSLDDDLREKHGFVSPNSPALQIRMALMSNVQQHSRLCRHDPLRREYRSFLL